MVPATLVSCALLRLVAPEADAAAAPPPAAAPQAVAAPAPIEAPVESAEVAPAAVEPAAVEPAVADAPNGMASAQPEPAPEGAAAEPVPTPVTAPEYKDVGFDIGLFPTVSINGKYRDQKIRNGVSLGLVWNRAAVVEGLTASMGVTVVDERADGLSFAFGGNVNRGQMHGVQAAFGFNTAKEVRGIQASHLFNHSGHVKGAQISTVNVAGVVRGAQFGLINIADEADASFALIPYTKKGGFHPEVFTSDTALVNLGFRLPANYTYLFASVGFHPLGRLKDGRTSVADGAGRGWEAGLGFGGHIPLAEKWSLDLDLSSYVMSGALRWEEPPAGMAKARMLVNLQLAKRFTIWGGPTLNLLVNETEHPVDRPGYQWISADHTEEDVRFRVWPGFVAGVRF